MILYNEWGIINFTSLKKCKDERFKKCAYISKNYEHIGMIDFNECKLVYVKNTTDSEKEYKVKRR